VSDPNLLFLALDIVALSASGACAAAMPNRAAPFVTSGLSGIGAMLCLPPLLFPAATATLNLPAGPPGLSLHLALGPLAACFLLPALLSGTAIAALQGARTARTALGLAGAMLSLLAADGITLVLGSALVCGAIAPGRRTKAALLIPLLLLGAVCLLTPAGFAPRFDTIRAAPVGVARASAAAMLGIAAMTALTGSRAPTNRALIAGAVLPAGIAILIRLIADLSGQTVQAWWGGVLIAAGGWIAVQQGWRAASDADIDASIASLVRRQAGLMMMGVGLALIARAADLPQTQTLALQATMLLALGGSLAGTAATLAADAIGASAGTVRLARLGGLIHTMPWTSAVLSASLLALSALPPGVGFASVWLLFQSLLAAPRTGGLLELLPLALAALAVALSAAAATSASVRIVGIAVLGRPRWPRGAGARDITQPGLVVLPVLAALALLAGFVPGPVLRGLTGAAVRDVAGSFPAIHGGLTMLSTTASSAGYAALPIGALLACAGGSVILALRWRRREGKPGGPWLGGTKPPVGLPFGEPTAQSSGAGFLPALPDLPALPGWRLPPRGLLPRIAGLAGISATAALWFLLAAFAIVLLAASVTGAGA
jgi:formate hydrogenlyase subunit 3/multisubunit Na+/H+ antiporter MnhD subunit